MRRGMVRPGMASQGEAGRGMARQGEGRKAARTTVLLKNQNYGYSISNPTKSNRPPPRGDGTVPRRMHKADKDAQDASRRQKEQGQQSRRPQSDHRPFRTAKRKDAGRHRTQTVQTKKERRLAEHHHLGASKWNDNDTQTTTDVTTAAH